MVELVARALGDDLLRRMAFTGGCATGLLIVDFMPTDERILGFTNRWYRHALASAEPYSLTPDVLIRLVSPAMFVATKLEAHRGRGNNDPLTSRDLEDLINLTDGRDDLVAQVGSASPEVTAYIVAEIADLLRDRRFEDAVQGNVRNPDREALIFEQLEAIAGLPTPFVSS
ncbi:hypothetical protein [Thiocapsa sp.]|uniref:hypothetical protein n=1 Tax=Thiocapsa sp. TaxID=2024551 RepID=UPI0025E2BE6F|nr:hypothetical protein [Thiocapsa sp.]